MVEVPPEILGRWLRIPLYMPLTFLALVLLINQQALTILWKHGLRSTYILKLKLEFYGPICMYVCVCVCQPFSIVSLASKTLTNFKQLILDFLKEIVQKPTVLVGNSVGSLACVIAASGKLYPFVGEERILVNSAMIIIKPGWLLDMICGLSHSVLSSLIRI